MASSQAAALSELYRGWTRRMADEPEMDVDEMRRMFGHWGDVTGEPGGIDYREVDAGGVPALWVEPKGARSDRALLCTHGGGYIVGSMYSHRKLFGHLAKSLGCVALIPNYRCAPEHPHPAPVDDTTTAYGWLLGQGVSPASTVFAGDSAGGALAVTTMLRARERGLPLPASGVLMSPWTDMEVTGASVETNGAKDALVSRGVAGSMAATFLGGGDPRDPLASPLHADLAGLPPLYVQVGDHETLLDDSLRFVANACAAGLDVTLDVFPEMQHVFQFMAGHAPEADEAVERIARWVKRRWAP